MNIALYSPLDPTLIGGMRTWLLDFWMPYAEQRQIDVRVIHTATRPARAAEAYRTLPASKHVRIIEIAGRLVPGSGANLPSATNLAAAIEGCDVLYFDNGYLLQDVVALRAATLSNAHAISGHHSVILHHDSGIYGALHNAVWSAIGRRVLPRFDAVHALNSTDAAYLERVGARNVSVIPLPVDVNLFKPGKKRGDFTVLFVGRLHMQKGIDRLVQVVDALLLERNVSVRIVGAGPEAALLERFKTDSRVTMLSRLSRESVAEEMRSAHVLLAPSRTETFGFVAAEALASGTPVIATPTNGFRDLITESNGRMIEKADVVQDWLRAILDIRELTQAEYFSLCERARASVQRLGLDEVAAGMDSLVEKVERL